jgi:hypothetical protein
VWQAHRCPRHNRSRQMSIPNSPAPGYCRRLGIRCFQHTHEQGVVHIESRPVRQYAGGTVRRFRPSASAQTLSDLFTPPSEAAASFSLFMGILPDLPAAGPPKPCGTMRVVVYLWYRQPCRMVKARRPAPPA